MLIVNEDFHFKHNSMMLQKQQKQTHAPKDCTATIQRNTHMYREDEHREHWNITMSFCRVTKPSKLSFLLISWSVSFHRQDGQVPGTRHQQRTCSQGRSKEKEIRNSAYMQDSHLYLSLWELRTQNENKGIWKIKHYNRGHSQYLTTSPLV